MECPFHAGTESVTTCVQCETPICPLCASETNQIHLCLNCYRARVNELSSGLGATSARMAAGRKKAETKLSKKERKKAETQAAPAAAAAATAAATTVAAQAAPSKKELARMKKEEAKRMKMAKKEEAKRMKMEKKAGKAAATAPQQAPPLIPEPAPFFQPTPEPPQAPPPPAAPAGQAPITAPEAPAAPASAAPTAPAAPAGQTPTVTPAAPPSEMPFDFTPEPPSQGVKIPKMDERLEPSPFEKGTGNAGEPPLIEPPEGFFD